MRPQRADEEASVSGDVGGVQVEAAGAPVGEEELERHLASVRKAISSHGISASANRRASSDSGPGTKSVSSMRAR